MPNATTDAILDNVRAALAGVGDDAAKQALFNVCDDLAREALRVAAPANVDGDPASWLPSNQWVPNFQALLAGTLAALYGQFGKPYFSPDLAKYNLEKYLVYRTLSRTTEAGIAAHVNSPHERIQSLIRAQVPACRDETIELEMYIAVDCIRVDGFGLAPLDSAVIDPGSWLTADQYEQAMQAIVTGTLYRLYGQAGMPWYSEPGYQANITRYQAELHKLRSEAAGTRSGLDPIRDRILQAVRAEIPDIRPDAVELAMFTTVSRIRVEALRQLPLAGGQVDPADWLTTLEYSQCYQAILAGTLAQLYGQALTPWYSAEQVQAKWGLYQAELVQVRAAVAGNTDSTDTIVERVVSAVRAQIPAARDEAIRLEMFNVANRIRVDAYRLTPLQAGNNPTGWLPAEQYEQAYSALVAGTLGGMFAQAATPWFNQEQFIAQTAIYLQEVNHLRASNAGLALSTDSIPERIVSTVRAQIQTVRDEAVKLALFNVVNKIRAEVYSLGPLTGDNTDYTQWLTVAQWEQSYLAALYGTLAGLYGQSNMPWYNLDQFKSHNILFSQELDLARSENIEAEGPAGGVEDILEQARVYLPGARDEVMVVELRSVMDEFLKNTGVWQEEVRFAARPNKKSYELIPVAKAEIVRIVAVYDPVTLIGYGPFKLYPIARLELQYAPSDPRSLNALCVLSILTHKLDAESCGGANWGVPLWIIERWQEVLLNGLVSRMMMQPQKSYSNTELGLYHGRRWRTGLADCRGATRQQNVYDGQTWRYPAYA